MSALTTTPYSPLETPDYDNYGNQDTYDTYDNYGTIENTTTPTNITTCDEGGNSIEKGFVNISVAPALFIVLCMTFFQRRKIRCMGCCGGRPAIAYPVNFVDEHERRWAYAAGFGIMTYKLLLLFEGEYYYEPDEFKDPVWMEKFGFVKVFVQIVNVIQIGIIYYPIFASIVFRRNIIANILGFLYTAAWLTISLLAIYTCVEMNIEAEYLLTNMNMTIDAVFYVPVMICYITLLVAYIMDFVINVRNLCNNKASGKDTFGSAVEEKDTAPTQYVRALLQRERRRKGMKMAAKLKQKIKYQNVPGLKYSPRVMCTMIVAGFALFKMAVELGYWLDLLMQFLIDLTDTELVPLIEQLLETDATVIAGRVSEGMFVARVSLLVCNALSFVIHVIFMVMMILNYRKHIRKYILGDRSWHFKTTQGPSSIVVGSMRYSGYQVAFIIYGWLILFLFLFLIVCVIAFLFVLPLRDGYNTPLISFLKSFWPTMLVSLFIMISQRLVAMFVFLLDRNNYMALDNRRWYHVTSYFLFFFNVILGIFSALRRILISMIAGIVLLGRLDRTLMMQGLERFDSGFLSYLGMLEVEVYHTHPIIRYFIECLEESAKQRKIREEKRLTLSDNAIEEEERKRRRLVLRNKWYKAITLINNPVILVDRLNALVKEQQDPDSDNTQRQMVDVLNQAHGLMGNPASPSENISNLYQSQPSATTSYKPKPVPSVPAYVPYVPADGVQFPPDYDNKVYLRHDQPPEYDNKGYQKDVMIVDANNIYPSLHNGGAEHRVDINQEETRL